MRWTSTFLCLINNKQNSFCVFQYRFTNEPKKKKFKWNRIEKEVLFSCAANDASLHIRWFQMNEATFPNCISFITQFPWSHTANDRLKNWQSYCTTDLISKGTSQILFVYNNCKQSCNWYRNEIMTRRNITVIIEKNGNFLYQWLLLFTIAYVLIPHIKFLIVPTRIDKIIIKSIFSSFWKWSIFKMCPVVVL